MPVLIVIVLALVWLFDRQIEERIAGFFPRKVFVVEEDHTSMTGQLSQAERLTDLYFDQGVRDIILEGHAGDPAPNRHVPIWLPGLAHAAFVDYVARGDVLTDHMPAMVPANRSHRLSIAVPELIAGNVSAAEFVAVVLSVRLHPGESKGTYERSTQFQSTICDTISRRTVAAAQANIRSLSAAEIAPYNRAYANAMAAGGVVVENGVRRLSSDSQNVLVRELLAILSRSYGSSWQERARAWREVCDDAGLAQVVSIEQMIEHYRLIQAGLSWQGGVVDHEAWRRDVEFLETRAYASAQLSERAANIARRHGRNVAVVIGAAHTSEVMKRLAREPGITPVHVAMTNSFGKLGNMRLFLDEWRSRQARARSSSTELMLVGRRHRMRRAPPVVQEPWFKARHELASIADRLVSAAEQYAAAGGSFRGAFVTLDASSQESLQPSTGLSGHLVRASVRLSGAEESLWIAARQSGYFLPATEDSPESTRSALRELFTWLKQLSVADFKRIFEERRDPGTASESRPAILALLSLRARAAVARSRDVALRAVRSLN